MADMEAENARLQAALRAAQDASSAGAASAASTQATTTETAGTKNQAADDSYMTPAKPTAVSHAAQASFFSPSPDKPAQNNEVHGYVLSFEMPTPTHANCTHHAGEQGSNCTAESSQASGKENGTCVWCFFLPLPPLSTYLQTNPRAGKSQRPAKRQAIKVEWMQTSKLE